MGSFSAAALASTAIIGLAATAAAAEPPTPVRGQIQSLSGNTFKCQVI
jgi:hypothetical protein